jgi:pimeloyl-ACP methyl ester carboxylesterase
MANGNGWAIDMPATWNGTVLLFSHGFSAAPGNPPRNRPHEGAEQLLARGYALLGSSYSQTGWAVEQAMPDQIAALDRFEEAFGKPRRVIAYGRSMGGLVTAALVERHPERIDGAMPMCASVSGAVAMENQALDGAWALKMLVDPAAPLRITGIWQQGTPQPPIREEGPAVDALLAKAMATPQGRARLALAATLAQLPDQPDDKAPQPPRPIRRAASRPMPAGSPWACSSPLGSGAARGRQCLMEHRRGLCRTACGLGQARSG